MEKKEFKNEVFVKARPGGEFAQFGTFLPIPLTSYEFFFFTLNLFLRFQILGIADLVWSCYWPQALFGICWASCYFCPRLLVLDLIYPGVSEVNASPCPTAIAYLWARGTLFIQVSWRDLGERAGISRWFCLAQNCSEPHQLTRGAGHVGGWWLSVQWEPAWPRSPEHVVILQLDTKGRSSH